MKKLSFKKMNSNGSALIMTIVIFLVVAIISSCLFTAFTVSMNVDLSTYKRDQAYAYAQTGLDMVYNYVVEKAGEPGGVDYVNDLKGKTISGTVSGAIYTDPSDGGPSTFPDFTVQISNGPGANILQFKSQASYQKTTATAVRYMYYTIAQDVDDDHAINSAGDYHIAGSITDIEGNPVGNLRGNNIEVRGMAEYNNIYALAAFTHNNSGLVVKQDIVAHGNVEFSGTALGNIQCVGSAQISNASGYPKSIIAWGESDGLGSNPYPGDLAADISINEIGSIDTADPSNVVLYSGRNASVGGSGGAGGINLYGTVIVNGDLYVKSTGIFHVYGDLVVKGDITGGSNIIVDGTIYQNLDDSGFDSVAGGYTVTSINAINKVLDYPRKVPVTIFPDVCNSPAVHPQRTESDGWDEMFVETAGDFAVRQATYNEVNLADEGLRKIITSGGGDDGTTKPVIVYEGGWFKSIVIYIDESGKYVNLDQLLNAVAPDNTANVVLYIDASTEDLDICLDKDWTFTNKNWGFLNSQLIVNDGDGTHNVRLFLEKGTNLKFDGSGQTMGTHSGAFSSIMNRIINGQEIYSATNQYDTDQSNYMPRLFIFSDGEENPDGSINTATQPHITVYNNGSHIGMLRGYIYTPYGAVDISSNSGSSPFVGKIEAGDVATAPNQETAVFYARPDGKVYSKAISGVYFQPESLAASSGDAVSYQTKPSRDPDDPDGVDTDYESFWLS